MRFSVSRSAFTLIELLVVIAIIAILAVVVVLTLNPAQLLAQSRDANRVSDMATLNSAINLYSTDQSGASSYSLGSTSTAYLSLPASTTNCSALGMATSGYSYACANTTNYRNASSSGWLPINFQNISSGSPFGSLPVDPTNQSSSNLYYSYETNGSQYVLSSFMESQKYAKNMQTTGGIDPALYEIGSGVSSLPNASRGLVGYWPLNEGTGNSAIDWSGYGDNGTWSGAAIGSSGYYGSGKLWSWAGMFDGSTTVASPSGFPSLPTTFTVQAWVMSTSTLGQRYFFGDASSGNGYRFGLSNGKIGFLMGNGGYTETTCGPAVNDGAWHMVTGIFNMSGSFTCYVDGAFAGIVSTPNFSTFAQVTPMIGSAAAGIGTGAHYNGYLSNLEVYARALSASEIQQIYNAEK